MPKGRRQEYFAGDYALAGVERVCVEAEEGNLRITHDKSACLSVGVRLKQPTQEMEESSLLVPLEIERRGGMLFVTIKKPSAGQGGLVEVSLSLPRSTPLSITLRGTARLTSRSPWTNADVAVTDAAQASFHTCGKLKLRTFQQARASCVVHEGNRKVDASATDAARVTLSGLFRKVSLYASVKGQIQIAGPVSKSFHVVALDRSAITHSGSPRPGKTRIEVQSPSCRVTL